MYEKTFMTLILGKDLLDVTSKAQPKGLLW